MFSTPTSRRTPGRSSQRPRDSLSVASRGAPSVTSVTPSIRSSRLAVVQRAPVSPTSSAGETIRTIRNEYESGGERVYWSRDERFGVCAAGGLPREVQGIIRQSDLGARPVMAYLDPVSGFAFVATPSECVAWNSQKRTHSSPTCYFFPAPQPTYGHTNTPPPVLAALFTSGSAEPGMILVNSTGEIRIWESMSLALSNVDRNMGLQLDLGEDEFVEKIWKVDASTFVITTSSSQAYRLTIASQSGRSNPVISPFTRPGGMFGRASTTIFYGREDKEGVVSVTAHDGDVYLLGRRMLQKWNVTSDGQKLLQEFDLHDAAGNAIFEEEWSRGSVELILNDVISWNQEEMAALVSFSEMNPGSSNNLRQHNSHAIIIFTVHPRSNTFSVSRVVDISYLAHPDPRQLDIPRLLVPQGSSTAFVRFADVIVTVSLIPDAPYEDVISLKESGRNAFIGIGCRSQSSSARQVQTPSLLLMPAVGGLLSVEVYEDAPRDASSKTASSTARLKSKMEQAVFFGDRSDNPLSFDLPAGFRGDVAAAAEAVSAEILASSSPYLPALFEVRAQLLDRQMRLRELMGFIRRNGLLSMLSQASRRRLSTDAEKIKAAVELWDYQNRYMDQVDTRSPQSLLSESIAAFMQRAGSIGDDDVIRSFFRTQVTNLDRLLELVMSTFRANTSSIRSRIDMSQWVLEIDRIFILVFRGASQCQEDDTAIYEVDRLHPAIEIWTAQTSLLDALEVLYGETEQLIKDRTRDIGSVVDESPVQGSGTGDRQSQQQIQASLKNQMAHIAAALCMNMEDKLRTASTRQMNGGADPQEGMTLSAKWAAMKPRVIRPLITIDRISEAYQLAEHHQDFPTLVQFCHDPVAGTGQGRVELYIERFGEDFAFVLYQWYIDQGQLYALLTQDEVYGSLLTRFFETYEYPELAWMHHIACKRYGEAASALLDVNRQAANIAPKHIMNSIGKLATVAAIKSQGDSRDRKVLLQEFDDELDLIELQTRLRDTILKTSSTNRNQTSPLPIYVQENTKTLTQRPTVRRLFENLAQSLVDGNALDVEGLVDILTLKDNYGEGSGDAGVALKHLASDRVLPDGRKQVALLSIWRRVFIRDDWMSIANTSGRSDETQRNLLRSTLTYQTVRNIQYQKHIPQNFHITPYTATVPPLPTELSARFPEWSPPDANLLMADHADEIKTLQRYIEEAGLERRVVEAAELVRADLGRGLEGGQGDVDM